MNVTHVDTVEMRVENDLTAWVDDDYVLTLDFTNSPGKIVSVKISDGTNEVDISASGVNNKFTHTITHEGNFTITAVSEVGTEKTFEITGCRFEKTPVNIQYGLKMENGVYTVDFSSESEGGVEYSYSVNGGAFNPLYQTAVPLVKDGTYIYKATNKAGKEAIVNVNYASSFKKDAPIQATVKQSKGINTYTFSFLEGLENIHFVRLDGNGGEVKIENNVAKVSESGSYAITAQKGDTLYVTSVFVNLNAAEEEGGNSGGNVGAIVGVTVATVAVTAGFLGAIMVLWRKKKHD